MGSFLASVNVEQARHELVDRDTLAGFHFGDVSLTFSASRSKYGHGR